MPKSRGRKKKSGHRAGVTAMTPQMRSALEEQRAAFITKFGREPGPGDPIFFDPDSDVPTPISRDRMEADLDETMRRAGIDPVKAAAFKKRFLP
jgi:hypothetical protein